MIFFKSAKNRDRTVFLYAVLLMAFMWLALAAIGLAHSLYGRSETLSKDIVGIISTTILIFIFFLYIKIFPLIKKADVSPKTMILAAILISIIVLAVWPSVSTDILSYIGFSRVFAVHGANPYITPYNTFPHDALYPALNNIWSGNLSIYGPIFTYISYGLAFFAGNSLLLNILFFKILSAAAFIGSSWMIYKISGKVQAMYLFAFNPFLLSELVINAHNDILMIFFFLLALFFLFKKNNNLHTLLWGWLLLVISILIKYFTLLFVPIILFYILKNRRKKRKEYLLAFFLFFASILIALLSFWPLWEGLSTFKELSLLVARKTSVFVSPLIFILTPLFEKIRINDFFSTARDFSRTLFILFYAFLLFFAFKRPTIDKKRVLNYSLLIFATFLFLFFSWFMPWYFTILIAMAAVSWGLSPQKKYEYLIYFTSFYGIIFSFFLRFYA